MNWSHEMRYERQQVLVFAVAMLWLAASLIMFLLLIAIPKEMAVGAPIDVGCSVYSLARRGWGCSKLGDFTSNPILTGTAIAISASCAAWFSRSPRVGIRATHIFGIQAGVVVCLAGAVRLIYFIQERVNSHHATITTIAVTCALVVILFCVWHLKWMGQHKAST
jgi:hypothetical protein